MNVDFSSLAVGIQLNDQLAGIAFRRYQGRVGGIVADTPSGHVASFNDCPGCEFFSTGADVAFSTLQRTVTVYAGLLPVQGIPVQLNLRLTAFDASGVPLATATTTTKVTAGAGFGLALTATVATPQIASVVLEAIDDPQLLAQIAIHDVSYEEAPVGSVPDFVLEGPHGVTVLQGGPSVDIPLVIRRIGDSTGAIGFSLSPLPSGVTASLLPNPASSNSVALRLQAAIDPVPEVVTVLLTGTPIDASAGPGPRTLEIDIGATPLLRLSGPADIDFAGCAPSGTHGTVTRDYWVSRDPSVTGPIDVSLEGMPADVTGTVNPRSLDFPAGSIGQRVTINLTTIAGPAVPDSLVTLRLVGQGFDLPFTILVFGSCAQENRNFVVRGQFCYLNQGEIEQQPLQGAQVEIFRWNGDWLFDDRVGGAFTDDQGSFSCDLHASRDGDYYARLRLHSMDAQVMDAYKSSVWSWDSPRQTNRGGLIDVGTWQFSRYEGKGSPHAAIWQGFRNAAIEFQQTTDRPVPGGLLNVENWLGHVKPLTYHDEVHWADGYTTGGPIALGQTQVHCYRVTSHEFGHVIRDVLDGDQGHWDADDAVYVYGRKHAYCTGPTPDSERKAGFAFHEGWAHYWAGSTQCCPDAIYSDEIEGTVAHDLGRLASCAGVGREGMVRVLARGQNLIHADHEFRREYALEFPQCPLGTISDGCRGAEPVVGVREQTHPILDGALQRERLVIAIEALENEMAILREQQTVRPGLRKLGLRAAVEEGALVVQRMHRELASLDRGEVLELYSQRAFLARRQRAEFVTQRREIQVIALREALSGCSPEQHIELERRLRLLQESRIEDASLDSMIPLPAVVPDDATSVPPLSPSDRRHVVPNRPGRRKVKKPKAGRRPDPPKDRD